MLRLLNGREINFALYLRYWKPWWKINNDIHHLRAFSSSCCVVQNHFENKVGRGWRCIKWDKTLGLTFAICETKEHGNTKLYWRFPNFGHHFEWNFDDSILCHVLFFSIMSTFVLLSRLDLSHHSFSHFFPFWIYFSLSLYHFTFCSNKIKPLIKLVIGV